MQSINAESETHALQILYNVMIISFLHCTGKQRPTMMENKERSYVTESNPWEFHSACIFPQPFKLELQDGSSGSNGWNKPHTAERISDMWLKTGRKRKTVGVASFVSCTQALR